MWKVVSALFAVKPLIVGATMRMEQPWTALEWCKALVGN